MPSHLDTAALRAIIERPEHTTHWGQPYTIVPRLVDRIFGDGLKLLLVIPLNTRPNYYVVRGDSSWQSGRTEWNPDDHTNDPDGTVEPPLWIEEGGVSDEIEEQFGHVGNECFEDDEDFPPPFPVADFTVGYSWGWMEWPDGFAPADAPQAA